jgi:arabinogalactan oligomer/maltooligosaccharide transport system permease protein
MAGRGDTSGGELMIPGATRLRRSLILWSFLLPTLLPMAVLVAVPMVQVLVLGFSNLRDRNFDLLTLGLTADKSEAAAGANSPPASSAPGVPITVDPGGPAARAGLATGDRVLTIDGTAAPRAAVVDRLLTTQIRTARNSPAPLSHTVEIVALSAPDHLTTKSVTLTVARPAFDWKPDPTRDSSTVGLVGLANYRELITPETPPPGGSFLRTLGVTLLWTAVNVTAQYWIGLGLALLLDTRVRGVLVYRLLLMLPWAVPVYVSAFAWRFVFNAQGGLANQALAWIGISPVPWLSDSAWTFVAATIANTWVGVPFVMIMLLAGLQSIPQELKESARVDGCTRFQVLWLVILPLLRPLSLTVILLGSIWTFNAFNILWLLQGGGNNVEILATRAFRLFRDQGDHAMAAAYGTVILLILGAGAALTQWLGRRRLRSDLG